jgi:hypothetical protein
MFAVIVPMSMAGFFELRQRRSGAFMRKSLVLKKLLLAVAISSIANCSAEDRCNVIKGSEISCRPGYNDPPPPAVPKGTYYKSCTDRSGIISNVKFVLIVHLEPIKYAGISCLFRADDNGLAYGRVEHLATDDGFSYTMPCVPDWSDSHGRTAVMKYDDIDTVTLKIMKNADTVDSEIEVACVSQDNR